MDNIEVYKQSERFATQFEVRKYLGLMDRRDCIDRLDFYHQKTLDKQVDTITELYPR